VPWRESFDPSCRLGTAGWASSCSKSRLFWPVCYGQPAYYRLYSWHVSWIQTGSYDKLITRYILTYIDNYVHAHFILLFLTTDIIKVKFLKMFLKSFGEILEKLCWNHFERVLLRRHFEFFCKFECKGNCSHSILLSVFFMVIYPCKIWFNENRPSFPWFWQKKKINPLKNLLLHTRFHPFPFIF